MASSNISRSSCRRPFPDAAATHHNYITHDHRWCLRRRIVLLQRKSKLAITLRIRSSSKKHFHSEEPEEDDDDSPQKRHKSLLPPHWKKWAVGISLWIILPSYRHKLGPVGIIQNKVDEVIETAETATEVVEDVAEGVKYLAEEMEKRLPPKDKHGKAKQALDLVEKLAEETIKTTDLAQEFIDKEEQAEEALEDILASAQRRKEKEKDGARDKH
uniref:Uncharacterized protein n=1 Tax=Kalanchoe fedtschenkoi TaxID=63787 RepID=A0A7N1A8W4_KALFE